MRSELRVLSDSIGDRISARTNRMIGQHQINRDAQAAVLRLADSTRDILRDSGLKENLVKSFAAYDERAANTVDAYRAWHSAFSAFLNALQGDLQARQASIGPRRKDLEKDLADIKAGNVPIWEMDIIMTTDNAPPSRMKFRTKEEQLRSALSKVEQGLARLPEEERRLPALLGDCASIRGMLASISAP